MPKQNQQDQHGLYGQLVFIVCPYGPHTTEPDAARDPGRQPQSEGLRGRGAGQGSLPRSRAGRLLLYAQWEAEAYARINGLIDAIPEVRSSCGKAALRCVVFRTLVKVYEQEEKITSA